MKELPEMKDIRPGKNITIFHTEAGQNEVINNKLRFLDEKKNDHLD